MNQNNQSNRINQNTQKVEKFTFLPKHGHYRHLKVYKVTEVIYDITYYFTQHYLQKGDRTVDQMVQAARSGVKLSPNNNSRRYEAPDQQFVLMAADSGVEN